MVATEKREKSERVYSILGTITLIFLVLAFGFMFGIQFAESHNTTNNVTNDIYYLEGEYYTHFSVITKDGRIWSSDYEVDSFHNYILTIDGRNTKDTSDDVLINMSTILD